MVKGLFRASLYLFLSMPLATRAQSADTQIRFSRPANAFQETLPLGNGRLGAMIAGDPRRESIILNEISLWSGGPQDSDNDSAFQILPQIRRLLKDGNNREAQSLLQAHFVSKGKGSGYGSGKTDPYGCYQTLGRLVINRLDKFQTITEYKRVLDLETGIARTEWEENGHRFGEEALVSMRSDVIVLRLWTDRPGGLHFSTTLRRLENAAVESGGNRVTMKGRLTGSNGPGMRFAAVLKVLPGNGNATAVGDSLIVTGTPSCVLLLSAATDYNIDEPSRSLGDPLPRAMRLMEAAHRFSFEQLKRKQTEIFSSWFNRCRFRLAANDPSIATMNTPERLIRHSRGYPDPQLAVLYFNFGRYLLISSSRPGSLPANLQGLWAAEYQTPWNGDYHININLQMNYWLAAPTALGELEEPLFAFTGHLAEPGAKTAWAYYRAPGWVAHVISNPWWFTSPGEGAQWGSTLTGGAWLCSHIWEHYRFTRDTSFLRTYYPVLRNAARFLAAILIREPQHGWLVTAPSNSPENSYRMPDGFVGQTCMGPTIDMEICRQIFDAVYQAGGILHADSLPGAEFMRLRQQLAPLQIGQKGDINEWLDDWDDAEPHHRHVSHLYGLHPYDEITPWATPQLAEAARHTLEQRGDAGTGWSKAWKMAFWARLGDGNHALKLLDQLLQPMVHGEKIVMEGGGTYPNLFCAHPPFQIDGNFGGAAGITEMLLQSHGTDEVIRLLPALPLADGWQDGSVSGLRARGAFALDFTWSKGRLTGGRLMSLKGSTCRIILPEGFRVTDGTGKILAVSGGIGEPLVFATQAGHAYRLGL